MHERALIGLHPELRCLVNRFNHPSNLSVHGPRWHFRESFSPSRRIMHSFCDGLTLVEILLVIAIIGVMIALLLPAIQSAREASRRASCASQLKQIAMAFHAHHNAYRHFPSGGWGFRWVGDPDRGVGRRQPGGWIYHVLPFVEEQSLHDMGRGQASNATGKWAEALRMIQTPLPIFNCPTRRGYGCWPVRANRDWMYNANPPEPAVGWARSCYAASLGDQIITWNNGPKTLAEGDAGIGFDDMSKVNGVVCQRSQYRFSDITDGLSQTYLVGEKYLNSLNYFNGLDGSDDEPMLSGASADLHAVSSVSPANDRHDLPVRYAWGSAHPGIFQIAFADGSVHRIRISIDPEVHRRIGNRRDGKTVDRIP